MQIIEQISRCRDNFRCRKGGCNPPLQRIAAFLVVFIYSAAVVVLPTFASAKTEKSFVSEEEASNVRIYKNANRAVVNVSGINAPQDFAMVVPQQGSGGSGIIINTDGYILTNFHVIERSSTVRVTMYDGTTLPATVGRTRPR